MSSSIRPPATGASGSGSPDPARTGADGCSESIRPAGRRLAGGAEGWGGPTRAATRFDLRMRSSSCLAVSGAAGQGAGCECNQRTSFCVRAQPWRDGRSEELEMG